LAPLLGLQFLPALLKLAAGITFSALAWGLLGIILALVTGRAYCSIFCPLGILQDVIMFIFRRRRFKYMHNFWRLRYLVVLGVVLSASAGFMLPLGLLDPYSFAGRIVNNFIKPALGYLGTLIYKMSDGRYLEPVKSAPVSIMSIIITAVCVILLIAATLRYGRFFCNTLCPAGAVLGLLSRFSLFKIVLNHEQCTKCGACARACKAGCIDTVLGEIDFERCVLCMNCGAACKFDAIDYKRTGRTAWETPVTDDSRRRFLTGIGIVGAGALIVPPLIRKSGGNNPPPVMPPGAKSIDKFTSRCTACQLCVSVCPAKVIKPAALEYGVGGIMMPRLDFHAGMCEYDCTVCSTVCPTGALSRLPLKEKRLLKIGTVKYYFKRCVIPIDKTDCGACAEHCPTGAIQMVDWKDGLRIPAVREDLCIGCGSCEFICPARPQKAVIVSGLKEQGRALDPHKVLKKDRKTVSGNKEFPF
jgi:ferredoxin